MANHPDDATRWKALLAQHPEFFRDSDDARVPLVWRRQFQRRYSPLFQRELTFDECSVLSDEDTKALTRRPLDAMELTSLIKLAVELHTRALDEEKTAKWWVPVASGVLSLVGAIAGVLLTLKLK